MVLIMTNITDVYMVICSIRTEKKSGEKNILSSFPQEKANNFKIFYVIAFINDDISLWEDYGQQ